MSLTEIARFVLLLPRNGFEALIRQPWLQTMADEIAGGNIKRKRDLPAACWQASYGGQKRSNATAVPSGLFALDIDHVEDPKALFEAFRERIPELGIYIVHKTPSTRGLRIVAACRDGLSSIGENQEWLSGELGIQHDAVTRDFARLSFLVPESYFYHYDAALFTDEPKVLLQSTGNLRLRPQATQSTGLQPAQSGVPANPETASPVTQLLPSRQNSQAASGGQSASDAAGSRYSEAVSNPVRSAGCTNALNQTCLEGSTRCEACPQMKWVFYDTTLPVYCPMLKIGNGVYNRPDGSIIVGTHIVPGCLLHSKEAYDPLYKRIRKANRHQVFYDLKK